MKKYIDISNLTPYEYQRLITALCEAELSNSLKFVSYPESFGSAMKNNEPMEMEAESEKELLELDVIRYLLIMSDENPEFIKLAKNNLTLDNFHSLHCRKIFRAFLHHDFHNQPVDLLSIAITVQDPKAHLLMAKLLEKRIYKEKAKEYFINVIQRILYREYINKKDILRNKIQEQDLSHEDMQKLIKQYHLLKPPKKANADAFGNGV